MKIVQIEWEDAQALSTEAWNPKGEYTYIPCICRTVGYVINETEDGLILTDSYNNEQYGHIQQISRAMIIKMDIL